MSIAEKIQGMRGKVFLYNSKLIKILQAAEQDGEVILATDKDIIRIPAETADQTIKQFMPCEDNAVIVAPIRKRHLTSMTETLVESIEKIKSDAAYIPQAEAISRQIGTLINVARLAIMMQKNDLI